ncbi:hypothetical protein TRIUR3_28008 [Triticum urartu]|uniref:Uncharacterized protein n=1 Tax=Triticum urartu TaxID=4572 RepID=M7ZUG5_TRIUA|nr:hypothetical protein TRIUR3_28008 [Triticum urartu]
MAMNPKMIPRQHIGSGSSWIYRCKRRCLTVPVTGLGVSPADPKQRKTKEPLAGSRQVVGLEAASAGTGHGISRGPAGGAAASIAAVPWWARGSSRGWSRSGEGGTCLIRQSGYIQAAAMAARRRGGRVAVTGGAGKSIYSRVMEVGWHREDLVNGWSKMFGFLVEHRNKMNKYMTRLESKT